LPWIDIQCRSGDGSGRTARMTQSGLQYALGGATIEGDQSRWASDRVNDFSPWLILYFLLLGTGIVAGYCLRWDVRRCLVVGAAAVATLAILAGELVWYLTEVPDVFIMRKAPPPASTDAGPTIPFFFSAEVHFTFWFYLVCALHVLALLSVIAEWRNLRRRPAAASPGDAGNELSQAA